MPTMNRVDMLNCAAGHHDFSDDADECHVCGFSCDDASEPVGAVNASLLAACEAAEHWLTEELANPGQTTPDEILRVLRDAIGKAKA